MPRRQRIWVDDDKTLSAQDVRTVNACDYYIRRNTHGIEHFLEQVQHCQDAPKTVADLMNNRELSNHIPRNLRQSLWYKKRAIIELQQRRAYLSRQS